MGRILALDWGEKRVGAAVSDETKTIAQALKEPLAAEKIDELLDFLIQELAVEKIIVGIPVALGGTETESTERAKIFANLLRNIVTVPVELVDERLSTKQAQGLLREQDMEAGKQKIQIDNLAAQVMLQNYLEKHRTEFINS
jgi:putative Holliday junction resolvase